jgi:Domain of unknown function (DUF4157)
MAQRELLHADKTRSRRPLIPTTEAQHGPQAARRVPDLSASVLGASGPLTRRQLAHSGSHLLQLQRTHGNRYVQRLIAQTRGPEPARAHPANPTGLPAPLKAGIEQLSGFSMEDVRVRYNSTEPAQLQALAYTRGTDIHVGPGQEQHLSHEAWHVVQQAQGRVQPLMQMQGGVQVNDNKELEREAEVMGAKALQTPLRSGEGQAAPQASLQAPSPSCAIMQRKVGFEFEVQGIETEHMAPGENWVSHHKGDVISREPYYNITADIGANDSRVEFVTAQFDETKNSELEKIALVASFIEGDMKEIVGEANQRGGVVLASDVEGIRGGDRDRFLPQLRNYLHLTGQLQMTGGVSVRALASIVSGTAMPDRQPGPNRTQYQDFAVYYKHVDPSGLVQQQPLFRAAIGAVNGFVGQADPTKGGIPGRVRGALAAVITLMAQIPLNMRGALPGNQAQFLARTDYAKILKMIGDDSGIDIDPDGFASALLSTINQFANPPLRLQDDVFPASYRSAGQQLTGVSIGTWARGVVPTPSKLLWGRWQGTDFTTTKNFPGTPAQKGELRAFGGFGSKTDPGNKLILEWRNFQMMYADELELAMTGLAMYLRQANA